METQKEISREKTKQLDSSLFSAAYNGDLDKVKEAIIHGGVHVDATCSEYKNQTMLHAASAGGNIAILQFLLGMEATMNCKDQTGDTPVHLAAYHNNVDTLAVLVQHSALLNVKNNSGDTPIHIACRNGSTEAIALLLSTGIVNPNERNNKNESPIELIMPDDKNRFEILKLFLPFQQCRENYPIDSYAKVFFCGNTTAGKSSLAAVLIQRANKGHDHKFNLSECVTDVVPLTAGIATHTLQSHEIGNVVLYDLAGHREYYSSHTAVLEHLMLQSPAVFCVLSKITDNDNDIANDLYYWLNFIENISGRLTQPSEVIVIASHVDLKDSSSQFKAILNDIVRETVHHNKFSGFVAVDCHHPGGKGVKNLVLLLAKSCKAVLDRSDSISTYAHVLYAFLLTLDMVAISLQQLCALLEEKNDPSLPSNESFLLGVLTILSNKGLILFLRRDESQSWIIIKKEALLEEVNGILFAPSALKHVYRQIASNTGLVPVSAFKRLFHDKYDTDMLVSFLIILEFCHVLDADALKKISTNLSFLSSSTESEQLLFIPALVSAERPPDIVLTEGVGWCLWCSNPHQFFPTRFLYILLLRLAFKYCLPKSRVGQVMDHIVLTRRCTLWRNGIQWISIDGIQVIVEVNEFNRRLMMLISDVGAISACQLQSHIISDIFSLQMDTCPYYDITECLISPTHLHRSLTDRISDIPVFIMGDVARAILLKTNYVTDGIGSLRTNVTGLLTQHEAFTNLCPVVIKELFDDSQADETLPLKYLINIQHQCSDIMSQYTFANITHQSVRDHLNEYSIFAGRNPLDVAFPHITSVELQISSKSFLEDEEQLDLSSLPTIIYVIKNAVNWKALGVQLNFEESILDEMESSDDRMSMEMMLSEWLKRGRTTRQILDEAIVKVISKDETLKRKSEPFQRVDQENLQKALKDGSVKCDISKVAIQGPARVGKTSIKCLILSKNYENIISTSCVDSLQIAVGNLNVSRFGCTYGKYWELIDDGCLESEVASQIKSFAVTLLNSIEKPMISEINQKPVQQSSSTTDNTANVASFETNNTTQTKMETVLYSSQSFAQPKIDESEIAEAKKMVDYFIALVNKSDGKSKLHQKWLYFLDCGGQIQFQKLMQAFIPCVSVLMLVTSLANDLSSQSSTELQCENQKYITSKQSLTVETILKQLTLMVDITTQQQKLLIESDPVLSEVIKPPEKNLEIIAVATHLDEYDKQKANPKDDFESIEDKEHRIARILEPWERNLCYYQSEHKRKILHIVDGRNALQAETFNDPMGTIDSISKKLAEQAYTVQVPIKWYAFEILLRKLAKKGCGVLSLQKCKLLGSELNIVGNEVESALKFFHILNTLLYYPKVAPIVFVLPESVIKIIDELMLEICKARQQGDLSKAIRRMAIEGIISKNVLKMNSKCQKISEEFQDFEIKLLAIFEHLHVASKLSGKDDEFFMPALLPLTNTSNPNPFSDSAPCPFLLYFDKGVSIGLFCKFINHLHSKKKKLSIVSSFESPNYSNLIVMSHPKCDGKIAFVECLCWFEVHCEILKNRPIICGVIESALEFFDEGIEPQKGFLCPCEERGLEHRHAAILTEDWKLKCSVTNIMVKNRAEFPLSWKNSPSGNRPYYPHQVPHCPNQDTRIAFSSVSAHSFSGPGTYSNQDSNTALFSGLMQPFPGPGPYPIQQMEYSSMYDPRLGYKRPYLRAFGGEESEDHTETDSSGSKRPYVREFRDEDQNSSEDKTHERQDHKIVLNTAPNEHDLIDLLADISDMWYQIGTALRISSKYLRGLLHREQDNTVKLSQVINTWLNTHPSSITWKTLIAAIEGNIVNNKAMGIKIRQRLGLSVDCEPS